MKLTAIQMLSSPDVEDNFKQLNMLLQQLPAARPQLVVLPECFVCFGGGDKLLLELAADNEKSNEVVLRLQSLAKQHDIWLVCGTIPMLAESQTRFRACSLLIDNTGEIQARYDKIHLFDVTVEDNTRSYLESKYTEPGDAVVTVDSPFGKIGMAVCYDIRFPGLFQAMGQIDVLVLPSAFTQRTGEAHWHALLKARSIELQAYVVGAGQSGVHANGRETYGDSVIYSPWGEQLSVLHKGKGIVSKDMDLSLVSRISQSMPVFQHNRFRSDFDKSR